MDISSIILLTTLIFLAAALYSSVGHAGASGYLAAMALVGVAPDSMKPIALTLNILVALIATFKYSRAGYFSLKIFLPFAAGSIPFAFIGGGLSLPGYVYKPIVGLVLLYSAYHLTRNTRLAESTKIEIIPLLPALGCGIIIGLFSGLTGVGGGIFLSPLLLLMSWANVKQTSGVACAFILVNSIAGLLGHYSTALHLPSMMVALIPAAAIGGWIGAEYGSKKFNPKIILRLLAVVLIIAGIKMILTTFN